MDQQVFGFTLRTGACSGNVTVYFQARLPPSVCEHLVGMFQTNGRQRALSNSTGGRRPTRCRRGRTCDNTGADGETLSEPPEVSQVLGGRVTACVRPLRCPPPRTLLPSPLRPQCF